jgi:DNA-directed RNA polymerase specialized sigma24 family protein
VIDGEEFRRRMQSGDLSVFDDLMPALRTLSLGACRDLRVFDSLREDIVQDVAFKVFTDWVAWRGDSSLSTWIYAIARNRCLDEIRRRTVRGDDRVPADGEDGAAAVAEPAWDPLPAQALCVQRVIAALEAQGAARSGSRRMIEVLEYCAVHDPSSDELARFLGTGAAAARERKSYLLRQLRALCLEHCGSEDCSLAGG